MAGAVQHGASTLPSDLFHKFPELETAEIHLATNFQNMIYDSSAFSRRLQKRNLCAPASGVCQRKKTRHDGRAVHLQNPQEGFWTPFDPSSGILLDEIKTEIGKELESEFHFLFEKLNAQNTTAYVRESGTPPAHRPQLSKTKSNTPDFDARKKALLSC